MPGEKTISERLLDAAMMQDRPKVRRLSAEIDALEGALRFYADAWKDRFRFCGPPGDLAPSKALLVDRGQMARAVLASTRRTA